MDQYQDPLEVLQGRQGGKPGAGACLLGESGAVDARFYMAAPCRAAGAPGRETRLDQEPRGRGGAELDLPGHRLWPGGPGIDLPGREPGHTRVSFLPTVRFTWPSLP